MSDSYDSSDDEYDKIVRLAKNNKEKHHSKACFGDPIKNYANLVDNITTDIYKSNFIKLKCDEDPLECRFYFLSFINYLSKIIKI